MHLPSLPPPFAALLRGLACLAALAAASSSASADLIQGKVVDSTGSPVQGVDITAEEMSSGDPVTVVNGGTDALGNFSATVPSGNLRVIFTPPPPPVTVSLLTEVENVVVSGTTVMGLVTLDAGVGIQGRLVNSAGVPVGPPASLPAGTPLAPYSAKIVLTDLVTEDQPALPSKGSVIDSSGVFHYAVPAGDYDVKIEPPVNYPSTLAPMQFQVSAQSSVDLGDVVLAPGVAVTGIVLDALGLPKGGMDFDVYDSATGAKLFTPGDSTQSTGFFNLSLPYGTWDVVADPPVADKLVSWNTTLTLTGADVNLGIVQLQPGFYITGHVSSSLNPSESGVDVDVSDALTGVDVYTNSSDNTNGAGNYQVVVPAGTYELQFSPAGFAMPLAAAQIPGVVVTGDTVLDAVLPDCPFYTPYGIGLGGSGGAVPALATLGGTARAGNPDWGFELSNALGGTVGFVAVGFGQSSLPLFGGTLLVDIFSAPYFLLPAPTGGVPGVAGSGLAEVPTPFPISGAWAGLTIFCQGLVLDPGAPEGYALSNGIDVTFCP